MAGLVPKEGLTVIVQAVFNQVTTDLGANLELGLYTNTTVVVDEDTVLTDLIEPSGSGYDRIDLANVDWAYDANTKIVSFAKQTFNGDLVDQPYGYFISSKGTTPRLIAIEEGPDAPYTIGAGATLGITPIINLFSPAQTA